mmetsp:Transcript_31920/g.43766  ORF Transcript_31920/g.43766 Transcript_31920/m.43766 type:complete len:171 (-) Transcript_31920:694-1206(-)
MGQRDFDLRHVLDQIQQEGLEGGGVEIGGEGATGAALEFRDEVDPTERGGEVEGEGLAGGVVGDGGGAEEGEGEGAEEVLGETHQVVVVGVGPVELHAGEFGVVGEIDAFVAELATDFVDTVEAADDEHFEVELGGDAEVHVEVEIIVVGFKGTGRGATSDLIHHRCFHL